MALEITGNVELSTGIVVNELYARTLYQVNDDSSVVGISIWYYINKASYEAGNQAVLPKFIIPFRYPYNRSVDGEDILLFTQEKMKEKHEELGYNVVITDI